MTHKKQLFEVFEGIAHINEVTWNNPKGSYDDAKEAAYQVEEALEGFEENNQALAFELGLDKIYPPDAVEVCHTKHLARYIVSILAKDADPMADVERFDKALDAIYFAVGSLHKLGLNPSQMVDGLQIVHSANMCKSGPKDSEGKVIKPANFVEPQPQLQLILDNRVI